jgi:tetratricopeptide (TPR) repeat protein
MSDQILAEPAAPSLDAKTDSMTLNSKTSSRPGAKERPRRALKRSSWIDAFLVLTIAAIAGFNGWWYWRETRPLVELRIVESLTRARRFDEAETALRERLRRTPNDDEARVILARVLGGRGDLLGCARTLHDVPFWSPRKFESLYREGSIYLMLDRARDAEAAWRQVIKDDPLHPAPPDVFHDAVFEILKLYATEDRWEDAHEVIWRAYDEATPEDRGVLLIWRMRSELERVAQAESIVRLRLYVAADSQDWEALRALARAERWLGLRSEAEAHFRHGLKEQPNDARMWVDYLTMLHEQGERDAWQALLARVPRSAESEPEIWKFRGLESELKGDLAGAADNYRKAIELNPYMVEYHYRLSLVEERLGHASAASEHRTITQRVRKARTDLAGAYSTYLKVRNQPTATRSDLVPAMLRLASICRALGFMRAADAWEDLAETPRAS